MTGHGWSLLKYRIRRILLGRRSWKQLYLADLRSWWTSIFPIPTHRQALGALANMKTWKPGGLALRSPTSMLGWPNGLSPWSNSQKPAGDPIPAFTGITLPPVMRLGSPSHWDSARWRE